MGEAVIVSAVRTAIGRFGGALKDVPATRLGAVVIREALNRAGVDPKTVDEIIMGQVLQGGLGMNPARQSAVEAGIPYQVPAMTINKVCGSSLKAVNLAAQAIRLGEADVVVAGGMESMSQSGYLVKDYRWGNRMGNSELVDLMIQDALWDSFNNYHMGVTAENIAKRWNITRQEQDEYAVMSQERAERAMAEGRFKEEIVPVEVTAKKADRIIFETDEHPRPGTTRDKLAGLPPVFLNDGTVTAGNSSGINDGAAALVIMSHERAESLGVAPLAVVRSYASAGVDPSIMGIGPVFASRKALARAGLSIDDLDLVEVNEAFAAQTLAVLRELKLDCDKVNVNGGAIALGHPVGASGARILVTLLHEMKRRNARYGLATLCIGGGQGIATIVERVW